MKAKRILWAGLFSTVLILALIGVLGFIFLTSGYTISLDQFGIYRNTATPADLDMDGDLDVILGQTRWENEDTSFARISLWFNQGGGQFTPGNPELPGGFSAAGGDIDGDGDTDLLILDGYRLTLTINQGGIQGGQAGVFKVNRSIYPTNAWRGHMDMGGTIILGDLNEDHALDSFVASCCYGKTGESSFDDYSHTPSSPWIWLNELNTGNRLEDHPLNIADLEGLPMRAAALGDLDGDGDLDVIAAIGAPTLGQSRGLADLVLLNDGSGTLVDSGLRLGDADSYSVALGDIDSDGDLDALVGTRNGALVWNGRVSEQKAPTFTLSQEINDSLTSAVFLEDFNGDGILDALLAGAKEAAIWWNNGLGTFTESDQHFHYSNRHGIAVEDFNGDGHADIFAGAYTDEYIIWLNLGQGAFQGSDRQ